MGFFASSRYAVVGASADREKYGNKVLRWYVERGLAVTPVNPRADAIEGLACAASLAALGLDAAGMRATSVSVVTPPHASAAVLREAARLGIRHVWFQPGSEPPDFAQLAAELGVHVLGNGACILVEGAGLLARSKL
ncbi:hypothetical protein LPJ63_003109 [Coemansia sp. RSA 2711]|nr:hypothetical protein LPJ63_003109 [Coemansia sp. RSA 2711]